MSRADREAAARRILQRNPPPVPPELHREAVRRGSRIRHRRRIALRLMWLLILGASVALAVWALTARPWVEPPSQTTPPW